MAIILNFLLAGFLLAIANFVYKRISELRQAQLRGCGAPPTRQGWEPIFGLDLIVHEIKLHATNKLITGELAIFEELKTDTFKTKAAAGTTIFTRDAQNIKAAFSVNASDWGVEPLRHEALSEFCGNGILNSDGPAWERSRRMIKPVFAKQNISDLTFFKSLMNQLVTKVPTNGATVDIQPMLMTMYIDAAQHFLLGQSAGLFNGETITGVPVDLETYLAAYEGSLMSLGFRMFLESFRSVLPESLTSDHWKNVFSYVDFFISQRLDSKVSEEKWQRRSLLEAVAAYTDDRVVMRNQVLQGMLAAQDTTAILISNAIFLLSRNSSLWDRLRAEVNALHETDVDAETLRGLELLKNIIRETLRIYPMFSRLNRTAIVPTTFPRGGGKDGTKPIFVPRGTHLITHIWGLHQNTDVFGENVDEFDLDSWTKITPGQWDYLPFGGGDRACLGEQKALNEASYASWRLSKEFSRLESRDDREFVEEHKLTTKNLHGCKVAFSV